jgi:hypothetical protein
MCSPKSKRKLTSSLPPAKRQWVLDKNQVWKLVVKPTAKDNPYKPYSDGYTRRKPD